VQERRYLAEYLRDSRIEKTRERANLRGYMPYRERFGYVPLTERRLYEGYMSRKRLNIAEHLRVEDEGYVLALRLCA
jgi:hypothetical protein